MTTLPAAAWPGAGRMRTASLVVGAGALAIGAALVPLASTDHPGDAFVLPKLVAAWLVLAVAAWFAVRAPADDVRPWRARLAPVDVAVVAFGLLEALALLASSDRHQSLVGERLQHQGASTVALYLATYATARRLAGSTDRAWWIVRGLAAGGVPVASLAVLQSAGVDPFWSTWRIDARTTATFGQPNALAAHLVLAVVAAGAVAVVERGLVRLAATGAAALGIAALVSTGSRGGFAGLAVAGAVCGLAALGRLPAPVRRRAAALGTAALLVVGSALFASGALTTSVGRPAATAQASLADHVDLWRVAVHLTREHPVLGTGPETFPDQFPTASRQVLGADRVAHFDRYRVESPHDLLLATASGSGLPSAAALVAVAALGLAALWRAGRRAADRPTAVLLLALVAALGAHLVTSATMSQEVATSWLWWLFLGAGTAVVTAQPRAAL